VACHWDRVSAESLLQNHRSRSAKLQAALEAGDGAVLVGDDGEDGIECAVLMNWTSDGEVLIREKQFGTRSRMDLDRLSHGSREGTPGERIRQGGKMSHSGTVGG
jgi:hypothetical protein